MKKLYGTTMKLAGSYALGNMIRRGVQMALIPFYTAYLSTAQFGIYSLINLTVAFLVLLVETPVVVGGLERFYYHPSYRGRSGRLLFNLFAFLVLLSGVAMLIFLSLANWINSLLFNDPSLVRLVQLYAAVLFLWPLCMMLLSLLKLREKAIYYGFVNIFGAAVGGGVTLYSLIAMEAGVYSIAYGLIASNGLMLLLCLPVFLRHATFAFEPRILGRPLAYGYPLLPSGASRLIMQVGDRWILNKFRSLSEIGIYSFGYAIAEAVDTVVVNPLLDGISPTIRKLEDQPDRQKRFIRQSATLYYALAVFVGLGVAAFSSEVVRILSFRNPGYWAAQVVIPIITFAFVQQALGVFLDWGLTMTNRSAWISGLMMFSAGLNIGLNFLLIPFWGIAGAAVATLVSICVWNVLKASCSRKFYGLTFEIGRLATLTVLGVALYFVAVLTARWGVWVNVPLKVVIVAVYPAVCLLTGLLRRQEKAMLRQVGRNLPFFRKGRSD